MKNFIALLLLASLVAIFIWPTRYKYLRPEQQPQAAQIGISHPLEAGRPLRVDRITGEIHAQDAAGQWYAAGNTRRAVAFERPVVDSGRTPSSNENERVVSQGQQTIESTQKAVDLQTQK